jgi:hypothetical protein
VKTFSCFEDTQANKDLAVLIHCNYLVNLAAVDDVFLEKSRASFREEVERALLLAWIISWSIRERARRVRNDGIALCARV